MPVSVRLHAQLSRARVIAWLNCLIGQLSLFQYAATGGDTIYWPKYVQLCYNRLHCASSQLASIGPFYVVQYFFEACFVVLFTDQTIHKRGAAKLVACWLSVSCYRSKNEWVHLFPSSCFALLGCTLASKPKPGAGNCSAWGEHLTHLNFNSVCMITDGLTHQRDSTLISEISLISLFTPISIEALATFF